MTKKLLQRAYWHPEVSSSLYVVVTTDDRKVSASEAYRHGLGDLLEIARKRTHPGLTVEKRDACLYQELVDKAVGHDLLSDRNLNVLSENNRLAAYAYAGLLALYVPEELLRNGRPVDVVADALWKATEEVLPIENIDVGSQDIYYREYTEGMRENVVRSMTPRAVLAPETFIKLRSIISGEEPDK